MSSPRSASSNASSSPSTSSMSSSLMIRWRIITGNEVDLLTLNYDPRYGGEARNDDFERYHQQRMNPSLTIGIIMWAIVMLLFLINDQQRLQQSSSTKQLSLIIRIIGIVLNLVLVLILRRMIQHSLSSCSLHQLRVLTILICTSSLAFTQTIRLLSIDDYDYYLSPSGIPLMIIAMGGCSGLLFKHLAPLLVLLCTGLTAAEFSVYGSSSHVGIGAWGLAMCLIQSCMLAYSIEIDSRRIFGLQHPIENTIRWRSPSSVDVLKNPKRLSEMLPEHVFSDSFSELPNTNTNTNSSSSSSSGDNDILPPIPLTVMTSSNDDAQQQPSSITTPSSTTSPSHLHHDSIPGLPRPISDPLRQPQSPDSSSSSCPPLIPSQYELWYDRVNYHSYQIAILAIGISFALFSIGDNVMLSSANDDSWLAALYITRYGIIIPIIIITFLLMTYTKCITNTNNNRYQLLLSTCAIITGIGMATNYCLNIPLPSSLTVHGQWDPASTHYLNSLLRYLAIISICYRLRLRYAMVSVLVVLIVSIIMMIIQQHRIPIDLIIFGVLYVAVGLWLATTHHHRQYLLHQLLLKRQQSAIINGDSSRASTTRPSSGGAGGHTHTSSISFNSSLAITVGGGSGMDVISSNGDTPRTIRRGHGGGGGHHHQHSSIIDFGLTASPRGGFVDDT